MRNRTRTSYSLKSEKNRKKSALAGNRTRAARVAGEHSTTEPPVLLCLEVFSFSGTFFWLKIN
jgi:hypothetical protein